MQKLGIFNFLDAFNATQFSLSLMAKLVKKIEPHGPAETESSELANEPDPTKSVPGLPVEPP